MKIYITATETLLRCFQVLPPISGETTKRNVPIFEIKMNVIHRFFDQQLKSGVLQIYDIYYADDIPFVQQKQGKTTKWSDDPNYVGYKTDYNSINGLSITRRRAPAIGGDYEDDLQKMLLEYLQAMFVTYYSVTTPQQPISRLQQLFVDAAAAIKTVESMTRFGFSGELAGMENDVIGIQKNIKSLNKSLGAHGLSARQLTVDKKI